MRTLATLWLAAAAASVAQAQPAAAPEDPVLAHFREYRAAIERNDLPAAEAAATAALAASEASNGPRTAVLALNLANLRLGLGSGSNALRPARTAHRLAAAPDAGVDPLTAELTLGQAELAAGDAAGVARLRGTFATAEAAGLTTDVYDAAVRLGLWGIAQQRYGEALNAWMVAERLAHVTDDPTLARARALTGQGAAILLASTDRNLPPPTDGGPRLLSAADAQIVNDKLTVAQRLLMPAALGDGAAAEVTPAQQAFAEALAWQSALLTKVQSQGSALPTTTPYTDDAPRFDRTGVCVLQTNADPSPGYPGDALERYQVGAVVLYMRLDARGRVVDREVIASVPSASLEPAVAAVAERWRVEREPGTPRNCRMPSSHFVPSRFVLQ